MVGEFLFEVAGFSWEFRGTMILDNQGVTTENGNFVGITFFAWEFRGTIVLDNQGVTTDFGNFVGKTFFRKLSIQKKIKTFFKNTL